MTVKNNLSLQQKSFINLLLPKIFKANKQVLKERSQLIKLQNLVIKNKDLNTKQKKWLAQLASDYGLKNISFRKPKTWNNLKSRVDIIPTALVLAQAANESAWGKSRFAKEGNNYFGQWCTKPGCGIIPRQREKGKTFEVRKFSSVLNSVTSYIHNINTNQAYKKLRKTRAKLRKQNKNIDAMSLAADLENYSVRRSAYVNSIRSIIERYQLV